MVLFSYQLFKNFYKEHLSQEVMEELRSYTLMLEEGLDESIVSNLMVEKNRERHVHMVFFDENFTPSSLLKLYSMK